MSVFDNSLPTLNTRKTVRGKYGGVIDQKGRQLLEVTEFEAKIKFDKKKIERANAFMEGNRIMGASGSGKMKVYLTAETWEMTKDILNDPDALLTLISELHDPDEMVGSANSKVALKNISFDEVTIAAFKTKDVIERDFPFTFDDYDFL
ncbi:phage tail tube protein [Bacillus pacificus]|uniref:phage tail tube protein n=1 Tax=Bacillus TaxID=1386 RepID=UPI000942BEFD|nr:phage tail tube protein [Bacillus pacificus]MPU16814.1 hypothetical protein [Acinetobacter baumannii]MCC2419297.1 phage tail tube protein [Bacillus pacificus]MCU5005766.1 phage tail tube protein [Bacillus pacificus]MCU5259202.1 phage tail tube protein [Bacillus pacificus]MCU5561976.1 phage tail tube protein [Bacillus pacificus]